MKKVAVKGIAKEVNEKTSGEDLFPLVAIGASAGGLEAVTQLLQNLPPDTGMAFIYVQHLSPDHKSILTSLLSKLTLMRVQEVKNKMRMEPNNLYVIPPGKEMIVIDGHIKLIPRSKDKIVSLPIDAFFTSLAEKHKEGAIGIILSGNASDGTKGLSAIKAGGGITFAQDSSAKFPSMPNSAIAAGAVDFIMSPAEMAIEITNLSKHKYVKREALKVGSENEIENNDPDLKILLNLINKETGVDFSHYKMPTIKRRILRRMFLYKIKTLKEYAKLLTSKNEEINILYQDLLINVTCFFRDTDAHKYLKSTLLPRLLKSKTADETLRIWIPACSTGEEAYSIAMTILELKTELDLHVNVQIFASDLSKMAITKARIGEYALSQLESIPGNLLQRFYTKTGNNYRIAKTVREMCVFTQHNILRDPPFSRVDLISCCNLLIYLDAAAQKKAIATFHYALSDGGYLILGKSETTGASSHLFSAVNSKLKIYARKKNSGPRKLPELLPSTQNSIHPENSNTIKSLKNRPVPSNSFDTAIDAVLLAGYMPASVIVNHAMDILQFRGTTDRYLKHASGKASLNILKMAPPEIAFELRSAISKAIKEKKPVRKLGIEMKIDGLFRVVNIEVISLLVEWDEPILLIIFSEPELAEVSATHGSSKNTSVAKDRRIKKLEEELAATRADMHTFTQEQEAFNEELQSANEEVVSSNEELQSVNEELETSKEEIESSNEQLISTNEELQTRNDLLHESYDYSEAIIATIHEPMAILDKDLRVKSANKAFYKNFKVKEKETVGTLLYDVGNKEWNIPRLRILLEEIITKNKHFSNFEVVHTFPVIGEKIMLLNANRIVQKKHGVQLILLAFQDVTEIRVKSLELLQKEKELFNKNVIERKAEKVKLEKAVAERTKELALANKELVYQNKEKEKRSAELVIANKELAFQSEEKEKRSAELVIANKELVLQNAQKAKLAAELIVANEELIFQNNEKEKRANELAIANEDLMAFNYISSHDLQEPLRKIQTFSSRILEKENERLSENGQDQFKRILSAAGRMRQLIEDLLAYSRTNSTERTFETLELNTIIEEVKAELKERIKEEHAIVEVISGCEINIIHFQFRQLLFNLIGNALKFTYAGRNPHITIDSSTSIGAKLNNKKLLPKVTYCHISIADNGIGFEPEFKDRIFEVFQKLHTQEKYQGTGIGLAIVKKIVDNHHGIITAKGELGVGATFDIYIPANN